MVQIEIWSDFVCPFCYIGKKKLDKALAAFDSNEEVDVQWKSYQLDPEPKGRKFGSAIEYMVETKGLTEDAVKDMFQHVEQMALEEGLVYDLQKTIPANTLKAHRLMQFAKSKGLGGIAEEALFSAHFIEFKDIDDEEVLKEIGAELGLTSSDVELALNDGEYENRVQADIYEAAQVGVRGVPFFVFNQKYAISGAQPIDTFTEILNKLKAES